MNNVTVKFVKMNDLAKTPTRGSEYAAGWDLYAATSYDVIIPPQSMVKIDTGIKMELPEGTFGAIYARSGLATKQGLRLSNGTAVIDSDYRGDVIVALYNDSDDDQLVPAGSRIAQLVVTPYIPVDFVEVEDGDLSETGRGDGGFGSTGVK